MEGAVPDLLNQEDIIELFKKPIRIWHQALCELGLLASDMICEKCADEGIAREMQLVEDKARNYLYWRCTAKGSRHKRTIRHGSEFFTWTLPNVTKNMRNNANRLTLQQIMILSWCWCWGVSTEAAATSACCALKSAQNQYSQCRRVCWAAMDDPIACPEFGPMGGPNQLCQIDECLALGRKKRSASGKGRPGPGDRMGPHRDSATEQAQLAAQINAENSDNYSDDDFRAEYRNDADSDDDNSRISFDEMDVELSGGDEVMLDGEEESETVSLDGKPSGWVFGIVWYRSREEKRAGLKQHCRFFSVAKRDAATLLPLIARHIAPGTQIYSDCWKAYIGIENMPEGYFHQAVNHSEDFIDPVTFVNTQSAEAAWTRLRHNLVRTKRGVGKELPYHLAEIAWKSSQRIYHIGKNRKNDKTFTDPLIFMNFLSLIKRTYPML